MVDTWRLLLQPGLPGYSQMAIDEALYRCADPGTPPVLRFYTWQRPTLSLGYFQDYKTVVWEPFLVHNKIDVVRRITGGRAVLHHREVTYAIVAPLTDRFANQSLQETYQLIAAALRWALQQLGLTHSAIVSQHSSSAAQKESRLPQCFVAVSKYEISDGLKKVIGSAQKRSRDRFLQHGSILLDFDTQLQQGCFHRPDPEIEAKIAPLNRYLGRELRFGEVVDHFSKAFQDCFNVRLQDSEPDAMELRWIQELEGKYQSRDWTEKGCK